jgi:hypothetical protein
VPFHNKIKNPKDLKGRMRKIKKAFLILSRALYDAANQFFALNVVSLYFPRWLTVDWIEFFVL